MSEAFAWLLLQVLDVMSGIFLLASLVAALAWIAVIFDGTFGYNSEEEEGKLDLWFKRLVWIMGISLVLSLIFLGLSFYVALTHLGEPGLIYVFGKRYMLAKGVGTMLPKAAALADKFLG